MTIAIIIVVTTIGVVGLFVYMYKHNLRVEEKEFKEICTAHKEIGYPKLDNETQMRMLETEDLTPIGNLIPRYRNKGIPFKLLKHYITISKSELKEYLKRTNVLERHKIESAPSTEADGLWIRDKQVILKEKGHILESWDISKENEAIDVFTDMFWSLTKLK